MEIGGLLQYYMLNTVIKFLFKNFIAMWRHLAKTPLLSFIHTVAVFARWRHSVMKFLNKKVNDCVRHIKLQKFTNFHAIRSWSFQNICNEIGWPRFLRHSVCARVQLNTKKWQDSEASQILPTPIQFNAKRPHKINTHPTIRIRM